MPRPPTSLVHPILGLTALAVLLSACGESAEQPGMVESADTVYVSFEAEQDIEAFFEETNYSPQHWAEGVREIPRLYITEVGARWRERAQTDLTVLSKKRIFFRLLAPLALRSNELIRAERSRLLDLAQVTELDEADRRWLTDLAVDYGLEPPMPSAEALGDEPARDDPTAPKAWSELIEELQVRVDEVPVSLVLAQAANESGWGTSRFAQEGNALFGQWTFGGSGMRNLNTHRAYARLRELRAEARAAGRAPTGYELAGGLDRYSERGQEYVDELRSMIDTNQLRDADATYLAPGPVYLVVPPERMPGESPG
jgi:Bax protein